MFATSGNAQIAYETSGDPTGASDVVLFHAGVTDRRSWATTIERLAPRHRCISFDARGFGETTYKPQPDWSGADDGIAVMDAAGVERAVLVACSMGGSTAIDLTLEHPERVSGLVLIGTAVRGAPYPENTEGMAAELEKLSEAAEEADDFPELNRVDAWMWLDGPAAPEGRVGGATRELFLEMNGQALRATDPGTRATTDAWSRLDEIKTPTLVLVGTLDMPDIQAIDAQLAERVDGARLVWLEGVAHLPQLEADASYLAEVESFLANP